MTYTDSADDDQSWTAQDERDYPPVPEPAAPDRQALWEEFARKHLGYGAPPPDPGTEPLPPDSRPLYQQWAEKHLGPIKDAIKSYLGGDNAAPPHEVDAAMAATQAANPGASTAEVVQKTIAGTADPLSPGYMDQAGQDALGGLGRSTTAGQAPAQTGYVQQGPSLQTYTGPQGEQRTGPNTLTVPPTARPYQVVNPPETRQEIMARGFDEKTADRIMNAGDPKDPFTQALSQYVPTGLLDSPEARKDLQSILGQGGGYQRGGWQRAAADAYATSRGGEVADYGQNVPTTQLPPGDNFATDRTNLTRIAEQLVDKANARNSTTVPGEPSTGLGKTTDTKTGQVTYPNTAVGRANQAADQARARGENPMYDVDDIRRGTPLNMPQAAPPSSRSAPARAPAPRAPAARGRRSDAGDDTGAPPGPQYAIADSGTMSDASNDVRSTLPAAPQGVGYAQANQPPSAIGFSGSVGDNVTTIPVRRGAPTPAGASPAATPAPVASTQAPTYPQGYKLVPATPAQGTVSDYDRAIVGPGGKVVNYVRKGEAPPSSDAVMNKVYSDNLNNNSQEFYRRLRAGEPTGIDLNQYKQGNYDFSQPLPPRQAPTAQSMADRDEAVRQNIIHAPAQGAGGDPVQDLLRRAAQTSDVNAQRMFTNEAYKIQETRRVNQQKSADAALKTFSTGEQNLIKSIYTKENAGNQLTPAEQALKDDYVTRIQQHSQQGAATTSSATSSATTKTINGVTYRWDGKGWLRQ